MIMLNCYSTTKSDNSSGTQDPLNGTWRLVQHDEGGIYAHTELILNNGSWESTMKYEYPAMDMFYDGPYMRGTFSTNNNQYTSVTTAVYGGYYLMFEANPYDFTTKWYSKEEFFDVYREYCNAMGLPEESLNALLSTLEPIFEQNTTTYSISGNTLVLGGYTYNKV